MNPQKARISLATTPALTFEERSVQPPSIGLTGKLDTSSSANDAYVDGGTGVTTPAVFKTYIPSLFAEAKDITAEILYSTAKYTACLGAIGVVTAITIDFSDGGKIVFNGWLADFDASQEDTVDASGSAKATIIIQRTGEAATVTDPTVT